jgi:hypothetical protein
VLDAAYFREILPTDVEATGRPAVVELHLTTGQTLRLRSVLGVHDEYVTLEAYREERFEGLRQPHWQAEIGAGHARPSLQRAVVAYGAIAALTIAPEGTEGGGPRAGFVRP